jgi:glutamate/tyrosine decarboxylase-like PLP-dependent enzyme
MTLSASYIPAAAGSRDQIEWNPECSRRGRGFAIHSALRELGRQGVAELVDRTCRHALEIVSKIGTLAGTEVLWRPRLNQGLVRFLDPAPAATEVDHDRRTDAVIAALNATGEVFFGGSTWRGLRVMRVSVVNWRTSDSDVRQAVKAVERILANLRNIDAEPGVVSSS